MGELGWEYVFTGVTSRFEVSPPKSKIQTQSFRINQIFEMKKIYQSLIWGLAFSFPHKQEELQRFACFYDRELDDLVEGAQTKRSQNIQQSSQ